MNSPSGPGPTDQELAARLKSLKASIAEENSELREAQPGAHGLQKTNRNNSIAMSAGFRVASELVANVCVGGLIGWQLDKWLGTAPILLLIFLLLGVASGFWSVYRIAMRPSGQSEAKRAK